MACTLMPRVIAAYRERYPDVDVRLADTLPEHLLDGLLSGEVELAVGPGRGGRRRADRAPHAVSRPPLADLPARPCLRAPPPGALERTRPLHLHRADARLPPARAARAGRRCARTDAARDHAGGVVHDDRAGHGRRRARAHGVPDLLGLAGARPRAADGAARAARLPPRGLRLPAAQALAVAGGGAASSNCCEQVARDAGPGRAAESSTMARMPAGPLSSAFRFAIHERHPLHRSVRARQSSPASASSSVPTSTCRRTTPAASPKTRASAPRCPASSRRSTPAPP